MAVGIGIREMFRGCPVGCRCYGRAGYECKGLAEGDPTRILIAKKGDSGAEDVQPVFVDRSPNCPTLVVRKP